MSAFHWLWLACPRRFTACALPPLPRRQTRKTALPEPHARFYAASVVLALEALHGRNYVYRRVTPPPALFLFEAPTAPTGSRGHARFYGWSASLCGCLLVGPDPQPNVSTGSMPGQQLGNSIT